MIYYGIIRYIMILLHGMVLGITVLHVTDNMVLNAHLMNCLVLSLYPVSILLPDPFKIHDLPAFQHL